MLKGTIAAIGCILAVLSLPSCRTERDTSEKGSDSVYRLSINIIGAGIVTGPDIKCKGVCEIELARGAKVILNAVPASEWTFVGWDGACRGKNTCSLTMESDLSVKAIFTYP